MTLPFPVVPNTGTCFYVSDSFSLELTGPAGTSQVHRPGVFSQAKTWGNDETFYVYLTRAVFAGALLNKYPEDHPILSSGVNFDARIGIYDVSQGWAPWQAQWVDFCKTAYPYKAIGSESASQLLNATSKPDQTIRAERSWGVDSPMRLVCTTPATGGPFVIGAHYDMPNGVGHIHLHYEHYWLGAVAAG